MHAQGWAVVVPVKRIAHAKSRLRRSLQAEAERKPRSVQAEAERERRSVQADAERERATAGDLPHGQLALALARDTVRAVRACPEVSDVLVVTDDPEVSAALGALGARSVPDTPGAGLNPAIAYGASLVARPGRWIAALAADLPALRPAELSAALRTAAQQWVRGFVPDTAGTGTTLLTAPPMVAIDPRFGPDSATAHTASGARPLIGDWPSLRRDVDTAADLAAVAELGLGPDTAALRAGPADGPAPRRPVPGGKGAAQCGRG